MIRTLPGKLAIKVPERTDHTKSGFYINTSYPSGSEYNYEYECAKVASMVNKSAEAQYFKKWNQIDKLRKLIRQEVAKVPKRHNELTYGADRYNQICAEVIGSSSDKVKVGDVVYFSYLVIPNLVSEGRIFKNGVDFAIINEDECYFKKTGDDITMLNGYCLIEPIPLEKGKLEIDAENNKFDDRRGIVAFSPGGLQKGDMVVFEEGCDIPLEYEMIRTLPKVYFCIKEEYIVAKIPQNEESSR